MYVKTMRVSVPARLQVSLLARLQVGSEAKLPAHMEARARLPAQLSVRAVLHEVLGNAKDRPSKLENDLLCGICCIEVLPLVLT